MKKYNKLEIIGFMILVIGFVLYILGSFTELPFVSENERIFNFFIPVGLLIWALGHMRKEKEENKKIT